MNRSTLIVSLGGLLFAFLALYVGTPAEARPKKQRPAAEEPPEEVDEVDAPEPPEAPEPPDDIDRMDDDDDDDDHAGHQRHRGGKGSGQPKTVAVKGPIEFSLDVMSGDVQVTTSNKNEVTVKAQGCDVDLQVAGDEVEAELDSAGMGPCTADVEVTLPHKSRVKIESIDGEVRLTGSYGDVDIESVNGGVRIDKAGNVDVEVVNGDVTIDAASGTARIATVEGDVFVKQTAAAPELHFESVNGTLEWTGVCGKGCRIDAEVFSGDLRLQLGAKSAFELKFSTRSGSLDDQLGLTTVDNKDSKKKRGKAIKATYGAGGGQIRAETYSGDLRLVKK